MRWNKTQLISGLKWVLILIVILILLYIFFDADIYPAYYPDPNY